ncbi:RNA-binding S4 domain-containing protein [Clostridium pasteurianum]|uniref:RQC P-site tRNA stabilizing factor n=1 Tax=Clostridium pasteurianum BC1 TaxID=86416 RepID=R4KFE8_CLOPA|nr:RNA-binding S4 domain-containing protein [Clostridium pasteurianum]AGK99274.1 ribosome-associated heat shock protein implicated in recycling of 50S subunit [Clostridium pasteurianum BC1]
MRLDKYLKISRIIKRRTVAKEACESGRVFINGKLAKPSSEVNEEDIIEIKYSEKVLKAKIMNISNHVLKENANQMYEIISDKKDN